MGDTTKPAMVRIPADIAQALDRLAEQHAARLGVPGSPEITRTFLHRIALRRGVDLLEQALGVAAAPQAPARGVFSAVVTGASVPCNNCGGLGKPDGVTPCLTCDGSGKRLVSFERDPNAPPCGMCHGAGKELATRDVPPRMCSACFGTGKSPRRECPG